MINNADFKQAIKAYLRDNKLTQKKFCENISLKPSTLSSIMTGKTRSINDSTVAKLLPALQDYLTEDMLNNNIYDSDFLSLTSMLDDDGKSIIFHYFLKEIGPFRTLMVLQNLFNILDKDVQDSVKLLIFNKTYNLITSKKDALELIVDKKEKSRAEESFNELHDAFEQIKKYDKC